jgi:hypothetical protein
LIATKPEPTQNTNSHSNKIESANKPGLLTEADLRKKLMKSMKSVSKPLPNLFAVGAVILTGLILLAGCSEGGGGGRVGKVCEDYCAQAIVNCLEIDRAEDLCIDACIADVEDAEQSDGSACRDAELTALICITELDDCQDIFEFAGLDNASSPFPVCTAEINRATFLCPLSILLD